MLVKYQKTGTFNDDLYFPHYGWNQDYEGCSAYFLTSICPNSQYNNTGNHVWGVMNHGFLESLQTFTTWAGIRPVVCLPSNIVLSEYKENNEFKYYNIINE